MADASYPVVLSHIRGLSEVPSSARGKAVINFKEGTVSVSVRGLPGLPARSTYQVMLVDNLPGSENSVALDRGPGGDEIIALGELKLQGNDGTLERPVDPARLRGFEVDMVVVTLKTPGAERSS